MYFGIYCRLNLSVGASNLEVLRRARRKLAKRARRSRKHRAERHAFYRAMLREHKEARDLYTHVMSGRI